MRNIISVLILIVALAFLVFVFRNKVGDIRPAVLPPTKTIDKSVGVDRSTDLKLKIPGGMGIDIFAENLDGARDLEFSPGGTLLVSLTSAGKIVALPGQNKDVLTGLDRPHGIAFYQGKLFVAEETKVTRYGWNEQTFTAVKEKELFNLPAGGRHFTRSIDFDSSGRMFVSLGSTCDVCEEENPWIGAIVTSDNEGRNPRFFADGLRNSVFITVNPRTNELWGTEMGRDFLGDELPPDEINIIKDGKNYGWPFCYGDQVADNGFSSRAKDLCPATEKPVYKIRAHSAPLGLTFTPSGDLLVAYHGSWNRSSPIGYKIVRLKINNNKIIGEEDYISGFLQGSQVSGRPVDLAFDDKGVLYISDDKAGVVYRVF